MERDPKMGKYLKSENLLGVPTIETPRSLDRLEKALTGQKDADLLIMSNLDDETLLSFCLANRSANLLCKDEPFWRNRFIKKYGIPPFTVSNWRRLYLKSVHHLNKHFDYTQVPFTKDHPLYIASKNKDYELVHLILFLDRAKLNRLAFFNGVRGAIEAKDRSLIDLFMSIENFPEDDMSLNYFLRYAAIVGDISLIDFFIEKGAADLQNSAVYGAIESKNLSIVKYIINKIPRTSLSKEFLKDYLTYSDIYGTKEIVYYFYALSD